MTKYEEESEGRIGKERSSRMANVQKLFVDRAENGGETTDDGRLAVLAFNVIRSQSVASVLCIIVNERNPLTHMASTPAHHERSGWGPSLTMTRERLEHTEGQGPLSEETKAGLGKGSWIRKGMGNVRVGLLQLLLWDIRQVMPEQIGRAHV